MSYFICHFIGVRKISRSKGLKSGQGGRSFSAERKAGCLGEKEKRRQGGWSSTLREEEAGDKVEEGTAEARIYRALRYILPVRN